MKKILIIVGSIGFGLFSLNTNFAYAMGDKPASPCAVVYFQLGPMLECPTGNCEPFDAKVITVYSNNNTSFCRLQVLAKDWNKSSESEELKGFRNGQLEPITTEEVYKYENILKFVYDIPDPLQFNYEYLEVAFQEFGALVKSEKRIQFTDILASNQWIMAPDDSLPETAQEEGDSPGQPGGEVAQPEQPDSQVVGGKPIPGLPKGPLGDLSPVVTTGGDSAVGGKPIPGLPKGPLGDLQPVVTTGEATGDNVVLPGGDEASLGSQESSESGIQSSVSGQNIPAAQFPDQTNRTQGGCWSTLNPGATYGFNLGWLVLAGFVLAGLRYRKMKRQ